MWLQGPPSCLHRLCRAPGPRSLAPTIKGPHRAVCSCGFDAFNVGPRCWTTRQGRLLLPDPASHVPRTALAYLPGSLSHPHHPNPGTWLTLFLPSRSFLCAPLHLWTSGSRILPFLSSRPVCRAELPLAADHPPGLSSPGTGGCSEHPSPWRPGALMAGCCCWS